MGILACLLQWIWDICPPPHIKASFHITILPTVSQFSHAAHLTVYQMFFYLLCISHLYPLLPS